MAIEITPRTRQRLVYGGVILVLVAGAWWMALEEDVGVASRETPPIDALIMPGDTHSQSLEAVAAALQQVMRRLEAVEVADVTARNERRRELEQLQRELQAGLASSDQARREAAAQELARIRAELQALGVDMTATPAPAPVSPAAPEPALEPPATLSLPSGGLTSPPVSEQAAPGDASETDALRKAARLARERARERPEVSRVTPQVLTPDEIAEAFASDAAGPTTPAGFAQPAVGAGLDAAPLAGVRLIEVQGGPGRRSAVGGSEVFLPPGSILSGVLLTGLDAPGGSAAQANPVPVLLRVKHEAILPNRFGADVRECFALLSAFGDLSSERASMRGEQISCVLVDGTVMTRQLRAYGVGEDGKAGVRGRVVTRQGAFIARAIAVGVLDGVSQAFNDSVQISVGQSTGLSGAAVGGFATGFGSAFDRIAEWYLDQADSLFPVIEIDVGRAVDVVLTEGLEFRLDLGGQR
jgi:conjugal transfer pilus assembly protein TraB